LKIDFRDQIKEAIWIRMQEEDADRETRVHIYYFQYDYAAEMFTKIDEAVWDIKVNMADYLPRDDWALRARLIASSVCGNESWNVYEYLGHFEAGGAFFVVDRRNMDSLTEPAGSIDVSYLGTLSLPQGIVYDKPYVWIMVERDERIQMLKLLPNE
jgi:hypothetical protein